MNYPVSDGRYGPIYTIAEGVKVVMINRKRWQLVIYKKGERDRRNFEGEEKGLQDAVRAAELYSAKIGLATTNTPERVLLMSDVASEWLKSNHGRWAFGTNERYSSLVRDFVNPVVGSMPLTKITRNHVKDLLSDALKIRSPKTVELIHAVISGIFGKAVDRGYTLENPANGLLKKVLPPKNRRNQSAPDPFSKEDLEKLLEAACLEASEPEPCADPGDDGPHGDATG